MSNDVNYQYKVQSLNKVVYETSIIAFVECGMCFGTR